MKSIPKRIQPTEKIMTIVETPVNVETRPNSESVGIRIRWGAIFAGATMTLGLYSLLAILGTAVGLTITHRVSPNTLTTSAIVWAVLTMCVSLFLGGMVASLFTVGESIVESLLYGIIMWAMLFAFFVAIGSAGVRTGFNTMLELSNSAQSQTTDGWENSARDAGVSQAQIDEWRAKVSSSESTAQTAQVQKTFSESATRVAWYAFLGMWLSMLAAAGGAAVGRTSRHSFRRAFDYRLA